MASNSVLISSPYWPQPQAFRLTGSTLSQCKGHLVFDIIERKKDYVSYTTGKNPFAVDLTEIEFSPTDRRKMVLVSA